MHNEKIQDRNMIMALYILSLAQENTILATSIQSDTIGRYLAVAGELAKYTRFSNPRYDINNKIAKCIKHVLKE